MSEARTVTATFALGTNILTVLKDGTGSGSVASVPTGINCGVDCAELYGLGTEVVLTAVADIGATFTGWNGVCSGTGDCIVTMDAAKSVTATFTLDRHILNVSLDGTGSGSVSSNPVGIICESDCSETYDYGTVVVLTAVADTLSSFTGWNGACSGTGDCMVTIDAAKSVTATFTTYNTFLPLVMNNYTDGSDLIVEDVTITANSLSVVISNTGNQMLIDSFWVDMYINPTTPPTDVNQTWETNGGEGLVWGVVDSSLAPGETLTLTLGSPFYSVAVSNFSGTIPVGSTVYVQVDSAGLSWFGNIQELNEDNNIYGPLTTTVPSTPTGMVETAVYSETLLTIRP
jgi:hypothetical protein